MNGRFFKNIETLEDLKKAYRKLALINHPDRGGNLEVMQAINAEYDTLFTKVKNVHKNFKGETYTKKNTEAPNEFKDIIDKLIKMDGIEIEIIGCFVWVSGDTKPHKEELKTMGFRWSKNKSMWYKSPAGYRRHGKRDYSIDEIRDMYGSQFKTNNSKGSKNEIMQAV